MERADIWAPLDTAVTATAFGSSTTPSVSGGTPAGSNEMFIAFIAGRGSSVTFTQDTAIAWATPPVEATSGTVNNDRRINGGFFNAIGLGGALVYAPTYSVTTLWAAIIVAFKPSPAAALGALRIQHEGSA
jgi:hypothetical protein